MKNKLLVDRSQEIDRSVYVGSRATTEFHDKRNLGISVLNIKKVSLVRKSVDDLFVSGSSWRDPSFTLKHHDRILLDAHMVLSFLENKELIPESWVARGIYGIFFPGTLFFSGKRWGYSVCGISFDTRQKSFGWCFFRMNLRQWTGQATIAVL